MENNKVAERTNQQRDTQQTNTSFDIDFKGINDEALERFDDVIEWLELDGEYEGKEYKAFNPKREDNGLACIIHESREQTRSGGILRDVRGA